MKPIALLAGAFLVLAPVAATAATLQMRVDGTVFVDQGLDDRNSSEGTLDIAHETGSGVQIVSGVGIRLAASPTDQLFADISVLNPTQSQQALVVEVTGAFSDPAGPGVFSSTANDVVGRSDWTVESWIGTSAFDRAVLALRNEGSVVALESVRSIDFSDYWITHVFSADIAAGTAAGASADFGVIPVPAAGFLLIGGLGALALMRRRKST